MKKNFFHADFPVVAIAGGVGAVDAFLMFLRNLRSTTGMAFIFLLEQHGAPNHQSLKELFSEATKVPVAVAETGHPIKSNELYIHPSEGYLSLQKGRFELSRTPPIKGGKGKRIDAFFEAIAKSANHRAIGVLLSGTGSDGIAGLKKIQFEGGITYVQSEKSARQPQLLRNAITSGAADFVDTPDQIAREIGILAAGPKGNFRKQLETKIISDDADDVFQEMLAGIRKIAQLNLKNYRRSAVERALFKRMELGKFLTIGEYSEYVNKNTTEAEALVSTILLHATRLFQDEDVFEILKKEIFPKIAHRVSGRPIRIWVPGCSSGEEAYSLAIVFIEYLQQTGRRPGDVIQIFGTDIVESVVENAREGIFTSEAVRDISPERLHRFFDRSGTSYQIAKTVRDLCIFARHDVIGDTPFSNIDLISCRNLLCYFDSVLQKRLVPIFHYALKPHGFLIIGSGESVRGFSEYFYAIDRQQKIYTKDTISPAHPNFESLVELLSAEGAEIARSSNMPPAEAEILKQTDQLLLSRYAPPSLIVNSKWEILQFRGHVSPFLEPISGQASLKITRMARPALLIEIMALLHRAKRTNAPVQQDGIELNLDGGVKKIGLEVIPFSFGSDFYYLILFFPETSFGFPVSVKKKKSNSEDAPTGLTGSAKDKSMLNEYMQSIIEEQELANQELRASNQELALKLQQLQRERNELRLKLSEISPANEEESSHVEEEEVKHK